jgi:hypothetical protein
MTSCAGSRRLLTYRRLPDTQIDAQSLAAYHLDRLAVQSSNGDGSADELNSFRRQVCWHAAQLIDGADLCGSISRASKTKAR